MHKTKSFTLLHVSFTYTLTLLSQIPEMPSSPIVLGGEKKTPNPQPWSYWSWLV